MQPLVTIASTRCYTRAHWPCALLLGVLILALSEVSLAKTIQVTVAPNNNLVFQPSSITINVGDTVQWVWSGSNHSTTSGTCSGGGGGYGGGGSCAPDGNWDSQVQNAPFTFNHTFKAAGTFPYFCRIHGATFGMVGSVTVLQPDFSLTLLTTNPGQVLVGSTANFNGRLSTSTGYSNAVNLSCVAVTGLPNPCTPTPSSPVPSSSGTAFSVAAGSSSAQDIQFAVKAAGTDPSHVTHTSATLTLHVVQLSVGAVSPSPLSVSSAGSSSATFTVSGGNGFTGAVDFSCSNLPANASCSFSPNPANLSASVTTVNVTMTVTTAHVQQGSYSVTVNAMTAGASTPRTTTFTLNVHADYALALTNPVAQVFPGQSGTFNGTLTPMDGYTGSVTVTCGQFDLTITCSPPGAPIALASTTSNFSAGFTTNNSGSTTPGDYVANITGTDANNVVHSAPATVRVVDFSLAAPNPTSISVPQGNPTAPITLAVSALGQWAPTVNLACSGPAITAGAQCFFSPSASVNVAPNSSSTVTLIIDSGAVSAGQSTVTLTATVPTTTQVLVGPDGGFFFSPGEITINQGDTVEWDWAPAVSIYPAQHSTTSGTCVSGLCTPDSNWDSSLYYPPHTFRRTFMQAGSFPYYCQMHGPTYGMVGTVTVRSKSQSLTLNITSATTTADLSVAVSHIQLPAKADPAPVGGEVQFNATVSNNTSGDTESANLLLTFSPLVTFGTLPGSCAASNGQVTCSFSSVNGTPAIFQIPLTVPFSRSVAVQAFVSSSANDSVPGNNTASDAVQVRPRPFSRIGLPPQIP